MYDQDLREEWRTNFCNNHWGFATDHSVEDCVQRSYMGMRVFFWVLGLIGMCVYACVVYCGR